MWPLIKACITENAAKYYANKKITKILVMCKKYIICFLYSKFVITKEYNYVKLVFIEKDAKNLQKIPTA